MAGRRPRRCSSATRGPTRHNSGRLWKAAAEFAPDPNQRESDGGNPASEARKFNNHINIQNCGRLPDRQVADLVDDQERGIGEDLEAASQLAGGLGFFERSDEVGQSAVVDSAPALSSGDGEADRQMRLADARRSPDTLLINR